MSNRDWPCEVAYWSVVYAWVFIIGLIALGIPWEMIGASQNVH